jgi:hypothetical protein
MRSCPDEIVISGEQRELMTDAKLREKGIDRAELYPCAPAAIAQVCGLDMVSPIRNEKRQGREPLDDILARTRACEPLQQLLQDQPRRHDDIAAFQGLAQHFHFRRAGGLVAAQR